MKYKIRIQIVDYTSNAQKTRYIHDLFEFARIAHIQPLKGSHLPGGDCFEIDLDGLTEYIQLQYLQLLNLLSARDSHFSIELRDSEGYDYF